VETYDVNNTAVQLLMVMKLQELIGSHLPSLTYDNLEDYLSQRLWRIEKPDSLHKAADQVMSITAGELIKFLSMEAVKDANQADLNDYSDLIGG
jgi:hypothetical protein